MFNHRFRKSLIVIGGSGEFGQKITTRFAKPWFKRWQVFNIDATPNPDATANFVIEDLHNLDNTKVLDENVLTELHTKLKEHAPEYDAIINVAKTPNPKVIALTDGEDLFEEYERVKRYEMMSSMLMVHLCASQVMSPDAYILFNSRLAAMNYD